MANPPITPTACSSSQDETSELYFWHPVSSIVLFTTNLKMSFQQFYWKEIGTVVERTLHALNNLLNYLFNFSKIVSQPLLQIFKAVQIGPDFGLDYLD